MSDTATAERILITPGQLSATLALRASSALAYCTDLDSDIDAGGYLALVRRWPNLSTGETLLWQVAAWLNGQGDAPDDDTLRAELDGLNYAAAKAVTA